MADDSQQRPFGQRLKHGLESKILVPAAAGLVTIGVKYLLKKLPLILEEKVLPKLVEKGAPAQVTQAVEGTATKLGDGDGAARAVDTAKQAKPKPKPESESKPAETTSDTDREAERRKREQRRQERKRALEKAA